MAGHPLRPATRHRLGKPLPHQQADRPRVHPKPKNLSTTHHAIGSKYPVLDPVSQAYPEVKGRLLTCYSPVRHSSTRCKHPTSAFDLHVLSTPPAFILSQDQTLRKKTSRNSTPNQPEKTSPEHQKFNHQQNPHTPNEKRMRRQYQ